MQNTMAQALRWCEQTKTNVRSKVILGKSNWKYSINFWFWWGSTHVWR